MKNNAVHRRFLFGLAGFREGCRRERSFRTHLMLSAAAIALLFVLQPPPVWWALLLCSLTMSLALELMNAAIEGLSDHLHPQMHPAIGSVKDMASGAALMANLGSVAAVLAMAFASS